MAKHFQYKIILISDLIKIGKKSYGATDISGQFRLDPLKDGLDSLGGEGWELCSIWGYDENSHFIFKKDF